jgi:hypothetical protein
LGVRDLTSPFDRHSTAGLRRGYQPPPPPPPPPPPEDPPPPPPEDEPGGDTDEVTAVLSALEKWLVVDARLLLFQLPRYHAGE